MPIIAAFFGFLLACGSTQAGQQLPVPATQPSEPSAQTQPAGETVGPTFEQLTADAVRAQIKALESDTQRDALLKAALLELYHKSLAQLGVVDDWRNRRAQFEKARLDAPAALAALRERVAAGAASQPSSAAGAASTEALTLVQAQQQLAEAEAEVAARQQEQLRLIEQEKSWAERRAAIPELLTRLAQQAKASLPEVDPGEGEPAELSLARRQLDDARRQALEEEAAAYREELRSYDARAELLALRRDRADIDLLAAEQRAKTLQQQVNDLRRAQAERQADEARRAAEGAPRAVRELAEQNVKFADERARLADKSQRAATELEAARERVKRITSEFGQIRTKVDKAGLTDLVGQQLRRQRSQLPDVRAAQRRVAALRLEYGEVGLREIELEALRRDVLDLESALRDMTASLAAGMSETQRTVIVDKAREVLTARRELVQALESDYEKYGQTLLAIKGELETEAARVGELQQYIDQKVLWIRSAEPIHRVTWRTPVRPVSDAWSQSISALVDDTVANPALYTLAALVLVLSLLARAGVPRRLLEISQRVAGPFTDAFRLTIRAAVESAIGASILPALLWFVAWRLRVAGGSPVQAAVADGLAMAAWALLLLLLVLAVCRPKGLAESHFRWRPESCRRLRAGLWILAVFGPPLRFITICAEALGDSAWNGLVGRGAFLTGMILVSYVSHRLLRANGGAVEFVLRRNPDGWWNYTRYLWYSAAVALPLVLAGAAAAGYYYAAIQLHHRVAASVWLGMGLLLTHALLVRWVFVANRRLARVQLLKKRAEQARLTDAPDTEPDPSPPADFVEAPDFMAIGVQTRKLMNAAVALTLAVGMYGIWIDILPAFSFLNDIRLWSHTVQVQDSTAGGESRVRTEIVPVTLASLALAATIVAVTIILSRNLPGLLEIAILSRLPLEPSGRYAVTAVSRYLLTIVGVVVAFGAIGVSWGQVQWLAAAITVGLGFGLQEIFANFVSGLIILFERPIRVGDTVTIGGTSGTVTRIRIRATTILDWDHKELIVPNREFITGAVVNWTLGNALTRMVVPVGVAYGSDPTAVRDALLRVARDSRLIVDDPAPVALFRDFGASSLNFELRAFVRSPDDMLAARHEVLEGIIRELARLNVEIAFPQLDLHVRSVPATLNESLLPQHGA